MSVTSGCSEPLFLCKGPCQRKLPESEFGIQIHRPTGKSYRNGKCHRCFAARRKKTSADYRIRAGRSKELETHYGMTEAQWDVMLKSQNGCCAICGESFNGQQINVDHSHSTGIVRGLLCGGCNRGLGQFKERSEVLRKAAEYLERKRA